MSDHNIRTRSEKASYNIFQSAKSQNKMDTNPNSRDTSPGALKDDSNKTKSTDSRTPKPQDNPNAETTQGTPKTVISTP
jgi:hypothetical protein